MVENERAEIAKSLARALGRRQAFCLGLAVRHKRSVCQGLFTCKKTLSLALSLCIHGESCSIPYTSKQGCYVGVIGPKANNVYRAEAKTEGSWVKNQVLATYSPRPSCIEFECDTVRPSRSLATLEVSEISSGH